MVKGILSATLIGGFIVWGWMAISWNVLPWHCALTKSVEDESAVLEALSATFKEDGIYSIPYMCKKELSDVNEELDKFQGDSLKTSKIVYVSINSSSFKPSSMIPSAISLIMNLVAALFVSLVVMLLAASGYGWKLFSIILIGLVVGIYSSIPMWNWWGYPLNYVLLTLVDRVIAWFLAGIFMAGLIRPRHPIS